MKIHLSPEVERKFTGISLAYFMVPVPEPYGSGTERVNMEEQISGNVQKQFSFGDGWEAHPHARAYVEFYSAMGLNGRKCSNPIMQAHRHLKDGYRSKSRLIDLAMDIEYSTSISVQIYDFDTIGGLICMELSSLPLQHCSLSGSTGKCKIGELISKTGNGELVHCPSLGNTARFLLSDSTKIALVRLMKPPALAYESMSDAIHKTWRTLNPKVGTYLGGGSYLGILQEGVH